MRALLTVFVSLFLLAAPLHAADEADLIVGTWEFQDGSGAIDTRSFGPDQTYMQETREGGAVTRSINGTYQVGDHNLVVKVLSVDPPDVEVGSHISLGVVSVDDTTLVLNAEDEEITGKRLSPAPSN